MINNIHKTIIVRIFTIIILTGLIVSCSNNDNAVNTKDDFASKLIGTYKGNIEIKVSGEGQGSVNDKIVEISKIDDSTVNVKLNPFSISTFNIPEISSRANITTNAGGIYNFKGTVEINEGSLAITGNFVGNKSGNDLEIIYTLKLGQMPMPITAIFRTTAKDSGLLSKGKATLNAKDYDKWVYYNFSTGKSYTHLISEDIDETSFEWDIAVHRYDIRTNGATAFATEFTDLNMLTQIPEAATFTPDEQDSIMVDLSQMMQGIIIYAPSMKNKVLSTWLKIMMNSRPPTYVLSKLVYIIKTRDDKYIKILFYDNLNEEGVKGYISFKYEYMVI